MRGEGGEQWDLVEDAFVRLVRIIYIFIINMLYIMYIYFIIRSPSQDYSDSEFGFKNDTDVIIRLVNISVRSDIAFY